MFKSFNAIYIYFLLTPLLLNLSCNKSSSSADSLTGSVQIQGKVQAGPVENAVVEIFQLKGENFKWESVTTTKTDSDGFFSARISGISNNAYLMARASGGSYEDEASKKKVTLPSDKVFLRSMIRADSNQKDFPITPLSNLVTEGLIQYMSEVPANAQLSDLNAAFEKYSKDVEELTGLQPGDISKLPESPKGAIRVEDAASRQRAAIEGFSQLLKNKNVPPSEHIGAYTELAQHFAKGGQLDGLDKAYADLGVNLTLTNPEPEQCVQCEVTPISGGYNTPWNVSKADCVRANLIWYGNPDDEVGQCGNAWPIDTCESYYNRTEINGVPVVPVPLLSDDFCPENQVVQCYKSLFQITPSPLAVGSAKQIAPISSIPHGLIKSAIPPVAKTAPLPPGLPSWVRGVAVTCDVASTALILADVAAAGPTGEGIIPACAIQTAKKGLISRFTACALKKVCPKMLAHKILVEGAKRLSDLNKALVPLQKRRLELIKKISEATNTQAVANLTAELAPIAAECQRLSGEIFAITEAIGAAMTAAKCAVP